jgi:hypothetical protein
MVHINMHMHELSSDPMYEQLDKYRTYYDKHACIEGDEPLTSSHCVVHIKFAK